MEAHDLIRVRGARENNLRDVSIDLAKRRLTVFTGVSGSGKSSLVFDTIAAESRRLIDETYPAFLQGFMPAVPRPDVDDLQGLTTAIVVDQERLGANPRSTVGTVTDAHALLRVLFSKAGEPYLGPPAAFSFNVPTTVVSGVAQTERAGHIEKEVVNRRTYLGGMCPNCEGRGQVSTLDLTAIIDESKSLAGGAVLVPGYTADGILIRYYLESGLFAPDQPLAAWPAAMREKFLYMAPVKAKMAGINITVEGLIPKLQKSIFSKDPDSLQPHLRAFAERAATFGTCPVCSGTRLSPAVLQTKVGGKSIADLALLQVGDLYEWVSALDVPAAAPLLQALRGTLGAFQTLGLGYLSLDRAAGSLSGGEAQRIKLLRHLNSALTDVTYVFDEPSIGLHPHNIKQINELLLALRDKGNTVFVIEHKPETIAIADEVVDLGPGAGSHGGQVCYQGDLAGLLASDTKTGRHLSDRARLKPQVRVPNGAIEIRGASTHNLQDVSVDIPGGVLTVITGVAGSGKSSLVRGSLEKREGVVLVDQSAIRGSRRSNPATYTGALESIRKEFAKANKVKPALFSSNSAGACPTCKGNGVIITELGFMETVSTPCETCGGKRFNPDVLEYRLGGLNIAEVLALSIYDAAQFFAKAGPAPVAAAHAILERLVSVGLGYVSLGQPLNTLSGGERQRLKLATQMAQAGGTYVLDEPTNGLHLADIVHLLTLLDHLVDSGRTVVVIEHHLAVAAHADWVIDLGPGAGTAGGRVVFEGTPGALAATGDTLTAQYLREYLR
ncbi:MAG: excinuclease ABC subunit UvrA [Promicromonosporaceae bacterium]|nr:excinuclease ABC subunit UvrA [Promicromonosporaceae bacterium]